jgi:hypothetical protein
MEEINADDYDGGDTFCSLLVALYQHEEWNGVAVTYHMRKRKQTMTVNFLEKAIWTGRIMNIGKVITTISVMRSIEHMAAQKMNWKGISIPKVA